MPAIEPKDIDGVIVDGQVVYYRPGEVIAIGDAARAFVEESDGTVQHTLPRNGRRAGGYGPAISTLPTAYCLTVPEDPLTVVHGARARGLRVQLNHVHFAHGGCRCDPCCGPDPYSANPYKATNYQAQPYKATPYKATAPARTNAVSVATARTTLDNQIPLSERSTVRVVIVDTGISVDTVPTLLDGRIFGDPNDHPDKAPPLGDGLVDPVAGHGTFIAGIIEQLSPGCDIWISQVIEPTGDLAEWDVATAIHALLAKPFDRPILLSQTILNLSFGGGLYSACNPLVGEAIAAAQEAGVVVVASAGNEASCLPVYPAMFPGVVSVGAVDSDGEPAHFTNRGSWVTACALGVDVVSTFFNLDPAAQAVFAEGALDPEFKGGWAIWSGTSFATPVVVAAIAKEMSVNGTSAVDARDAVLGRGAPVPCLGVRVDEDGFSAALQAVAS